MVIIGKYPKCINCRKYNPTQECSLTACSYEEMVSITTVYPNDGEIVFSDNSDCIISAEREDYITIVTDLLFAYLNKDSDFPHEFERKAVKNALEFLSAQGNVQYKITDFFDDGDMES